MQIRRLTSGDTALAKKLFSMMAEVFVEHAAPLSDPYLDRLLSREDFWALAALAGDEVVGGLTAHTVPLTRTESSEMFIYDLAVRQSHQRQGIGRQLVSDLRAAAAGVSIADSFVFADDDDTHALDFYRALGGTPSNVTCFTFTGT